MELTVYKGGCMLERQIDLPYKLIKLLCSDRRHATLDSAMKA
jgi:hypothetical protein